MGLKFKMITTPRKYVKDIPGQCANCGKPVYECLATLDDAYGVYDGICPHCGAINYLDTRKTARGYDSREMYLVLPNNEEVIMNGLPPETPTRGWDKPEHEGTTKEELIAIYG
jgi:hypothetical protein